VNWLVSFILCFCGSALGGVIAVRIFMRTGMRTLIQHVAEMMARHDELVERVKTLERGELEMKRTIMMQAVRRGEWPDGVPMPDFLREAVRRAGGKAAN
jgi:hypothetical protein